MADVLINKVADIDCELVADRDDASATMWVDLRTIEEIIRIHADSEAYTWVLAIIPGEFTGGTPSVVYFDYLNHEEFDLPVVFSIDYGCNIYDISRVPVSTK